MNRDLKYRSISANLFNVWRIFVVLLLIPIIVYCIPFMDALALKYFLILSLSINCIYIIFSYSVVSYDGRRLKVQNLFKTLNLNSIQNIRTWWSYDIGITTRDIKSDASHKMKGHINKMNCYVEFTSEKDSILIYEQIHMGNKFPNNHDYLDEEKVDKKKLVKVWDIDNCLKKLGLQKKTT